MPVFIHTADLHLRKDRPERLKVFEHLIETAREKEADVLLSGDLFDSVFDANALRSDVRALQERLSPRKIFLIPGNHDAEAFDETMDYGENIVVLKEKPFTFINIGGLRIVGLPFQHSTKLSAILAEANLLPSDILLAHGTLFSREHPDLFLEVSDRKEEYFPIYSYEIEQLKTRYLALGHIHNSFFLKEVGRTTVCYPGSPLAVTNSETGRRHYAEVSIDGGEVVVEKKPIDVLPYIERETFFMFIGGEMAQQAELRRILKEKAHPQAKMFVDVKGYIGISEHDMNDIRKGLEIELAPLYAELRISNRTTSYKRLIESNNLVREFVRHLEDAEEEPEVKQRALELSLQAFDILSRRS